MKPDTPLRFFLIFLSEKKRMLYKFHINIFIIEFDYENVNVCQIIDPQISKSKEIRAVYK
jgi:hypothetical protein